MDKFEDFIKENTKFSTVSTQEELEHLKSLNKKNLLNYKIFWRSLVATTVLGLALLFIDVTSKDKKTVSDSVAENYVIEVYLAVDKEISDSDSYETDLL